MRKFRSRQDARYLWQDSWEERHKIDDFFLLDTGLEVFSLSEFGIEKSGFEHHLSTLA